MELPRGGGQPHDLEQRKAFAILNVCNVAGVTAYDTSPCRHLNGSS
jgi:hypothetical protein